MFKGLGIGLILSTLIKGVIKLFDAIFSLIASILIYFGLWVPFFYGIFSLALMLWCGLDLKVAGVTTNLFYFGLIISLLNSIIISVKHLIVCPIKEVISYKTAKREFKIRQGQAKKLALYKNNPAKYYARYPSEMPPACDPIYTSKKNERDKPRPLIYRSNADPSLIIHEYSDKFEVFKEQGNNIVFIETKRKTKD